MKISKKYKVFLNYAIFGFIASVVNVVVFNAYHINMGANIIISNTLAWLISNLASFAFNKHIVFRNSSHSIWLYLRELGSFFSTRAFSWVIDMAIMYIGIWILPTHPVIVKIVDQVLVGILNYVLTKLIFTHNNRNLINRIKNKKS